MSSKAQDDNDRKQAGNHDPMAGTVPYVSTSAPARRTERRPLEVVKMADVNPESIDWLWAGRIPRGCLTVLDGDPGLGKSTLVCELAASLTCGRLLPGQQQSVRAGVLIVNAEDSIAATIRTRLDAAGADVEQVWAVRRPDLQIPDDLPEIEAAANDHRAGLIVLDPFMAYLSERTNSFKDQQVRRALAPLQHMAERLGVAVLVVRHMNKATGGPALYRGGGSIGIIGAARSGLLLARDPDDPERRILAAIKNNLARSPRALRFRLVSVGEVARIEWLGECDWEADRLVGPPESEESRTALDSACEFLRQALADGPQPQANLIDRAAKESIRPGTLKRAKQKLGVISQKSAGERGRWEWELPPSAENRAESPSPAAPVDPLAPLTSPSVGGQS